MSLTVCCPVPTGIASVVTTLNPCAEDVGQIQKLIFWRRGNSLSVASASISTTWTDLFAATGDTKAVPTPFVSNIEIPMSDPREFGGGNETQKGAPIRKGSLPTRFAGKIYQADQDTIAYLKDLSCEILDVIFYNEKNQLVYSSIGGRFYGFQIVKSTLFFSDKCIGGLEDADYNDVIFNLKPKWSDTLALID